MIELCHVYAAYRPEHPVLQDLSLRVHPGERVGILGANGAGKTTLLLLIAGLMRPQAGEVVVLGHPQPCHFRRIRENLAFLFPDPDDQLLYPRVLDELRAAAHDPHALDPVIQRFGLRPYLDHPVHTLSPGLKKRLALAVLFLRSPRLWLLDEPTAGLDPRARRQLIQDIRALPGTVMVATHDLDFVWDVCERTLLLDRGRMIVDAPTRILLRDRALLEAHGLDLPLKLQGGNA